MLSVFTIISNLNDGHRFSSIALAYQQNYLGHFHDIPGASLYFISKRSFIQHPLCFLLLNRQNQLNREEFLYMMTHLQGQTDIVHFILGDINIDYYKNECDYLRQFLSDYVMIVTGPTHISGSLIQGRISGAARYAVAYLWKYYIDILKL